MTVHEPYIKAAGNDHLTPFYDLMARLMLPERRIKERVIALAQLAPGRRLLDLGCGTGTLVLMAQRRHPQAVVVGVDGDSTILAIARRKAARESAAVQLDEAMAYALPYADASFDAVVSTLAFHHLTLDQQQRTLAEVRRVLRPGGRLVIADPARPHNRLMRLVQQLPLGPRHRHARESGTLHGPAGESTGLEQMLAADGWRRVAPTERFMSLIGTIAVYALGRADGAAQPT
ncbi:MAG TPA: class I SAM-dependent methyltransferase [Dehalococcoidia bacterium]|jgi:SAM-dependent methyltransferase|nr:class I SAM-dependent methyltransferase [Dehalococcoidia bacterium]